MNYTTPTCRVSCRTYDQYLFSYESTINVEEGRKKKKRGKGCEERVVAHVQGLADMQIAGKAGQRQGHAWKFEKPVPETSSIIQ